MSHMHDRWGAGGWWTHGCRHAWCGDLKHPGGWVQALSQLGHPRNALQYNFSDASRTAALVYMAACELDAQHAAAAQGQAVRR